MKKFWTLVACTLMATSISFAQEEEYYYGVQTEEQSADQASEPWPDEAEQSSEVEPAEETAPADNKVNKQTSAQPAKAFEPTPAPAHIAQADDSQDSYERPANNEQKFGIGLRAAFDYGMMYGFKI